MTAVSSVRNCAHDSSLDNRHRRKLPSLQPALAPPRSRRKPRATARTSSQLRALPTVLFLFAIALFVAPARAAFINFENCLNRSIRYSNDPPLLRFTPMFVWASFNTSNPNRNLNVTIYGNVSGQATTGVYPPPDDLNWSDPKKTFGKIVNVSTSNPNPKYTTLFSSFRVLTYSAYTSEPQQFCAHFITGQCPIGPSFELNGANASDPATLSAFTVTHDFFSTYSFATWASNFRVVSGDAEALELSCVSANITPSLGDKLSNALQYLPAAILALVAIATIFAATCSPWGTSNIFRWSSNYGRDEDLLRLVTPGFGDCLQYIQFIVLAGSLSLNYPGFFQPVVSQASWSVLLFNSSLVSKGGGSSSLQDGIYSVNGTYGLSRLGEYVGMSAEEDIWAGMAVWLLGIVGIVTVLVQLGFIGRWLFRLITNKQDGDLTGKNWAFTAGNVVRLVFNFFLLPIISISLFQLVVAPRSNGAVVGTAVVLLTGVMGVAVWIFWFIFTTRPRAHLFDDLPTVLMYGPLYNTYSDDAAPFAFIPVLLTTIRGVAIGAIQPSGIAQIIILAICEVILILTLHAFRPFQSNTSMNAYHTFFSTIRLVTVLLMVAFVPSLGVGEAAKGWIGYVILLLHAIVLVFGFFLNSLQTIIEVAARLTGAGADQRGGLTKVFGKRQLSKRTVHRHQRSSLGSNAAMLAHDEHQKNQLMAGRSRSLSGSSAVLLNQPYGGSQRASMGFDGFSQGESGYGGTSPGTPGTNATPFSILGGGSGQSSRRPTMGTQLDNADPYYRPPRPRKHTMDSNHMPGVQNRGSGGSADLTNSPYADNPDQAESGDLGEASSTWGANRNSITPAFLRMQRDDSDPNLERRNQTDYSVRESDFYYGLRGPALSSQPTRKLKTGPADPMSPVSSATGWIKTLNLFSGKKKEKSKGFEVVRSTRVPPQMMPLEEDDESPAMPDEPYRDSPDGSPQKLKGSPPRQGSAIAPAPGAARRLEDSDSDSTKSDDDYHPGIPRVSERAPTLGPIETGGGIELPSRVGSRASHATKNQGPSRAPTIPRKNSRRTRSTDQATLENSARLSTVMDSPLPRQGPTLHPNPGGLPIRLPFGSGDPSPSPERSPGHSAASSMYRRDDYVADDLAPPQAIETGDRPLSTGYVHQHVTRDSLQNDGYDAGTHLEASAEIVDRSRSISTMQSSRSRRD